MTAGRRQPDAWRDVAYERLIEIQERQASIAQNQAEAGVRRDEILSKITDTMAGLKTLIEGRTPLLDSIQDGVDEMPAKMDAASTAIVAHVSKVVLTQIKKLKWWLFISTFLGSLLGGTSRQMIEAFLKLHP